MQSFFITRRSFNFEMNIYVSEFSLLIYCHIQAVWISQPGINNEYFKSISKACSHHADTVKQTLSDT